MSIRFTLNGRSRETAAAPSTTLLDHLRETERLTGTKEGCAEGDCGACTVTLARGEGRPEAINACITLLGQVDGCAITTVEGLIGPERKPHPVQERLAETDGTQCGFCTPGFVMSLYAFAQSGAAITPESVHEALAGNLCRCTGYRPILETALSLPPFDPPVAVPAARDDGLMLPDWSAPRDLAGLLRLRAAEPDAVLVAGATDLGLGPARERRPIARVIHIGHVAELAQVAESEDAIEVGAAVTYTRALPLLARLYPSMGAYLRRLGSAQIRNTGTIGGNLGTASPIGDMPPLLLALDATIALASLRGTRQVPVADFFTGYRQTVLAKDEVITGVRLPKLRPGEIFHCDKVSKRFDQDISTVAGAFRLRIEEGRVALARLAYGGMAAVPKRVLAAEAALTGRAFDGAAVDAAIAALDGDLTPIDDMRGSAAYRKTVAGNLLRRLHLETSGAPASLDAVTA